MKKFLNKFFNIILNILIVFVLICLGIALYSFIQIKVLKNGYVNYFGYTYFHTISGSMESFINIDDFVFVKITDDVKVDDVISYKSKNMIVTHRVIDINGDSIVTKGDANNIKDAPIERKQIIGKVIYVGRSYGKIYKVVSSPLVFGSFFVTVILFSLVFSDDKKERS